MIPLTITKKMINLPRLREGGVYPYVLDLPHHQKLCEALKQAQSDGWLLRTMGATSHRRSSEERACCPGPSAMHEYKLRVLFVFERDIVLRAYFRRENWYFEEAMERKYVKGGFLYNTPDQFEYWQEGQ